MVRVRRLPGYFLRFGVCASALAAAVLADFDAERLVRVRLAARAAAAPVCFEFLDTIFTSLPRVWTCICPAESDLMLVLTPRL